MKHKCPGRWCTAQVSQAQLACRSCWYQLPAKLRTALNDAYRNRHNDPHEHRRALADALDWYRANPVRIP